MHAHQEKVDGTSHRFESYSPMLIYLFWVCKMHVDASDSTHVLLDFRTVTPSGVKWLIEDTKGYIHQTQNRKHL